MTDREIELAFNLLIREAEDRRDDTALNLLARAKLRLFRP